MRCNNFILRVHISVQNFLLLKILTDKKIYFDTPNRLAMAVVVRFLHTRISLLTMMIFTTALLVYLLLKPSHNQHRPRVALYQDQPLLNLTKFHFLISPDACHPEEKVKAILLITSHSGHVRGRMGWRNAIPTEV
jgi:hypothetical protein